FSGSPERSSREGGRARHWEFIRYCGLLDLEFDSIGMQMSVNPDLDYLRQLTDRMGKLKPIRDAWAQWTDPGKNVSQIFQRNPWIPAAQFSRQLFEWSNTEFSS